MEFRTPVIISEYAMPDDRFVCIGRKEKTSLLSATKHFLVTEKLFVPKKQIETGVFRRKEWKQAELF